MKLGDLCDVITKGTTPTSVGFKFESDGVNFVKVESLTSNNDFIPAKFAKISPECNESLKRSQLQKGDILFSIAGALGRTAIVSEDILPANTNQALAIIRLKPNIEIDTRYLLYTLNSDTTKEQSERNKGGVAQQNLSLTQLKNYDVYLPPIAEQQRIVAKLDAAFAKIDESLINVEKAIQAAEDGLANLVDDKTKNKIEWNEYKVSDLGSVQTGNTPKTSNKENYGLDMPFVKPPNFQSDGKIVPADEGLSSLGASQSRIADKNSIMMVCIGATIGKVGICSQDVCFNQQINALTPRDEFDAELIYWQMRGRRFQSEVRRKAGQATLPIINKSKWQNLSIFLPDSLIEQVEIRELLRDLNSKTEDYINHKQLKRLELSALKSAMLAQELQSSEAA